MPSAERLSERTRATSWREWLPAGSSSRHLHTAHRHQAAPKGRRAGALSTGGALALERFETPADTYLADLGARVTKKGVGFLFELDASGHGRLATLPLLLHLAHSLLQLGVGGLHRYGKLGVGQRVLVRAVDCVVAMSSEHRPKRFVARAGATARIAGGSWQGAV
jgi:hypothetical protein